MLYHLLVPLADEYIFFNVFRYLTFRAGGAVMTSLLICFILGRPIIQWLKSLQGSGQPIREDGPEGHLLTKHGTPTMGGVMILLSMVISTLLWADLSNPYVWIVLLVTTGFGVLGFIDDYMKLTKRSSAGMSSRMKFLLQCAIACAAYLWIADVADPDNLHTLALPFVKDLLIDMGWFYLIFAMMVMVGSSNAVNLTDGLDGLAIVPVMIACGCFALITYLVGNAVFSDYLQIHFVRGTGEVAIICTAMIGAGLGFLWFNAPPAQVFMGDTGALALGAALAVVALQSQQWLLLPVVGIVFVAEALSVIIQTTYFKYTRKRYGEGRRVFRMAPLHHHFELCGWSQTQVTQRFVLIGAIAAMIGIGFALTFAAIDTGPTQLAPLVDEPSVELVIDSSE